MDQNPLDGGHAPNRERGSLTDTHAELRPARTPKTIGHYRIKRVIATGGMGTVYEALQEQPRRAVAVKVMKHGVASRSAMRRFEYESQLLARLRHPGIAQIYEAGTYDDGSGPVPFFAMEYICNAKTITEYARERNLDTNERLRLFIRVCEAAHHGHQKGIIHRDLKPANILVDSHGDVKIIDFGVARGTDSDLAVTTLQTDVGQLLGTLQYMSPEQCEADPHDIDTRSDVYAMGVVLYELLSGRLPYDVSRARIYESTRVIRESQPTSLRTVNSDLRGDIETLVCKALEKDRERRYQSAAEMGADIQRLLDGEAIMARPPSLTYQLRIFTRKNKPLVAAVTAIILALTIGLVAVSTAYVRVQRAQAQADRSERLRQEAEQQADRERAEAQALRPVEQRVGQPVPAFSATTLEGEVLGNHTFGRYPATVLNFVAANCPYSTRKIRELNKVRTDYGRAGVRFVNVAQTMKNKRYNAAEIDTVFTGQGWDWELVHDAGNLIGHLFNIRGYPKMVVVDRQGKIVAAGTYRAPRLAEWLAACTDGRPPDSVDGEPDPPARVASATVDLGVLEDLCRRRLEIQRRVLGDGAASTAEAMSELADLYAAQGKTDEAEPLYREAIEVYIRTAGRDSSLTQTVIESFVELLRSEGRFGDARPFVMHQLESLKDGSSNDPVALNEYAWSLLSCEPADLRDPEEAVRLAQKAVELSKSEDPAILDTLAVAYQMTSQYELAIETQRKAIALLPAGLSADRTEYETVLCQVLQENGAAAAAEPYYRELLAQRRAGLPPGHPDTGTALLFLGQCLLDQCEYREAEDVLRECLAIQEEIPLAGQWRTARALSALGAAITGQARFAEAEPMLLDSYDVLKESIGAPATCTTAAIARIVILYEAWGQPEKAGRYRAQLAAAPNAGARP